MTIESIVRGINRELVPVFEEKLRAALADRDREWLVEQVVRLTLDAQALNEADRRTAAEAKTRARRERHERVAAMAFDATRARGVHRGARGRHAGVPDRRRAPAGRGAGQGDRAAGGRGPHRLGRGAAHARQGRAVRAALRRRVDGLRPAARPPGAAHPGAAAVQGARARLHARLDRARRRRHLAGPRQRVERRARRQRPAGGAVRRGRGRAGRRTASCWRSP